MTGFNIIIAIALGARPHQYLEYLCYFQQIQAFYWYLAITGNRDQSLSSWTGHFLVYIAMKLGIPSRSHICKMGASWPIQISKAKVRSMRWFLSTYNMIPLIWLSPLSEFMPIAWRGGLAYDKLAQDENTQGWITKWPQYQWKVSSMCYYSLFQAMAWMTTGKDISHWLLCLVKGWLKVRIYTDFREVADYW